MSRIRFFRNILLAPMLLALHTECGSPAPAPAAPDAPQPTVVPPVAPSAADIAAEIMKAVENRSQRLEGSISKAVAEKYGMTEDEIAQLLSAEKEKRSKALPVEVQKKLDDAMNAANERLVSAEIRVQASALGFVDADDAIRLLSRDSVKVNDKGEVTGVKEALEALATAKPHLIRQTGAWGARQGTPSPGLSGVEEAFYRRNPDLKKN